MNRSRFVAPLGVLLLGLAPLACGGGDAGPATIDTLGDLPVQDVADVAVEAADDVPRQDTTPPGHRYQIIFKHSTTTPTTVLLGENFNVNVQVIDYVQDKPAEGVLVHFDFLSVQDLEGNNADTFDGSFSVPDVPTDANGDATGEFRSGLTPDLLYTVQVSLPDEDAEPKTMQLLVPAVAYGCINVTLTYQGDIAETALRDIQVYVLPNNPDDPNRLSCNNLFPERPAPDSALADRTIADLSGSTEFNYLPAGSYYTLWALGHRDGSPCVVIKGCVEGIYLQPDTCTDRTIDMTLASLNTPGRFDCIDHFDFSELLKQCAGGDKTLPQCVSDWSDLSKSVCCVLGGLVNFFDNPGSTVFDAVMLVADQVLGSIITDTFKNLFRDAVSKILTNWIKDNSPDYIQNFFRLGTDTMGIITHLEMLSDLTLNKASGNNMNGSQYWHGLNLYWKFGCDPADPNYATCGKYALDLEVLNDPLFPTSMLGGTFDSDVTNFDQLTIYIHAVNLNYGKLVLYVLDEIVIKGLTGGKAHTLLEIAHQWFDCASIANGILGEIASWFGGTTTQLETVCTSAIDGLFGNFIDSMIRSLSLNTQLSIQGTATLVDVPAEDDTCDLKVEQITKGLTFGFIQGNGSQASVTGDFTCERQAP